MSKIDKQVLKTLIKSKLIKVYPRLLDHGSQW